MHDLDEINAAIALGDHAIPPKGVKFRWGSYDREGVAEGLSPVPGQFYYTWGKFCLVGSLYLSNLFPYEVLEIPDDAPPFSEWNRA